MKDVETEVIQGGVEDEDEDISSWNPCLTPSSATLHRQTTVFKFEWTSTAHSCIICDITKNQTILPLST